MYRYVYVAGPYTYGDPVVNVRKAIEVAEQLIEVGFVPYVPHLSHLWHLASPHEYGYWLALDLQWVLRCDVLLRLPGRSLGADAEANYAIKNFIPVVHSIEEILEANNESNTRRDT